MIESYRIICYTLFTPVGGGLNVILMDIDEHVEASFTKKKKFLKRDYQKK